MNEPFVAVPRSLFDAITRTKLPGAETRVLLYLIGQTLGWGREETSSYGSIAAVASGSGVARRTAIQALQSLCDRGIVRQAKRGGPGKGASSYKVHPVGEWECTSEPQITSEQERTSEPHPASERECTSERGITSERWLTTASERGLTTGSERACTLRKKRKRIPEEHSPQPPARIDIDALRQRLGLRGLVPPIQHELWVGISQQPQEAIDAALEKARGKANPGAYFLALFTKTGEAKPDLRDDTGDDGYPAFLPGETERENSERAFAKVDWLNYEL